MKWVDKRQQEDIYELLELSNKMPWYCFFQKRVIKKRCQYWQEQLNKRRL